MFGFYYYYYHRRVRHAFKQTLLSFVFLCIILVLMSPPTPHIFFSHHLPLTISLCSYLVL